ncbi:hypothetical protein JKP88DRAFT_256195, partial [Tribonema minus]
MSKNSGLTSVVNDSARGQVLRSAAAAAEDTIKISNRFSPCSVNELTSWVPRGATYTYNDQDKRHKGMVKEAYVCHIIKEAVAADTSPPTLAERSDLFTSLGVDGARPWTQCSGGSAVRHPHRPPAELRGGSSRPDTFKPCKEYTFLCSITEDAFFFDIFISKAFFLMRARRVAEECTTEGVNRDELLRQVFEATSDSTTAGYNNNLASVFGAIERSGAERYRPDAMDIAAIRAYMPSADLAWLDTSGQALTYSVKKFIDAFRDTFLTTRRRLRADVTVSRALDRGGLKSKKAAGRLPDAEDAGLRDMMRALRKQIWSRVWTSVIAPWLRAHALPQDLQSFMNTYATAAEEGNIIKFADSKGFTRSQVWRDSVIEEHELSKRDGK